MTHPQRVSKLGTEKKVFFPEPFVCHLSMPCAAPHLLLRDPSRDLPARSPAPLSLSRSGGASMTFRVELVFHRPLLGAALGLTMPHLTINIRCRPLSGAASGRTPLLPIINLDGPPNSTLSSPPWATRCATSISSLSPLATAFASTSMPESTRRAMPCAAPRFCSATQRATCLREVPRPYPFPAPAVTR
jgi:hypothetical protein